MCIFSNRIEEERKRLGLNQDAMARAGGISKRTYCYYESGEREPGAGFLAAIAAAGADVQYIITGVRRGTAVPYDPDFPEIDAEMVFDVLGGLDRAYVNKDVEVKPGKLRLMVQLLCEILAEDERASGKKADREKAMDGATAKKLLRLGG